MQRKFIIAASAVLLAITLAYANYFFTGLHLNDYAAVSDNPAIRSLKNAPRFFIDPSTSSIDPFDYVYRPIVTTSLAIDYFIGKGSPFVYHLDTFLMFLTCLVMTGWLFFTIFEQTIPHPWNPYLAIMATALFGLHPAVAEILNPVSQRGELLAALGVVGGVAIYAALPGKRNLLLYLILPAMGVLANPAGLIFGPMLLAYILLIEPPPTYEEELTPEQTKSRDETQAEVTSQPSGSGPKRIRIRRRKHPFRGYLKAQLERFMPTLLFTAGAAFLQSLFTPFQASGEKVTSYWFTQPWAAWLYFRSFFWPFHLSPANDLAAFTSYHINAVLGLTFLIILVSVALLLGVSPQWRPTVFGIAWFVLGILAGAAQLQADVAKDTRMFLPFIGLALSVTWAARVLLASGEPLRRLEAIVASGLLLTLAYGTHARNQVWSNEETLWEDAIRKNPRSVRGLLNYGIVLASQGQTSKALEILEKARDLNPQSPDVEANLGTVTAALNLTDDADDHFHTAISLAAGQPVGHFLYATWLEKQGNRDKAIDSYAWASSLSLRDLRPRYGLMRLYLAKHDWNNLRMMVEEARAIAPGDPGTAPFEAIVRTHPDTLKGAEQLAKEKPTPENYLELSNAYCLAGEYLKCLGAAQKAIELRPDYSSAYNNAGAAYISMGRLDEAIAAVKKALALDPDDKSARANLNSWEAQKLLVGNAIMRK